MPIYDFKCQGCGRVVEMLVRGTSGRSVRCADCGSSMERLISASHMLKMDSRPPGATCCGRTERCEAPPCSTGDVCRKE